MKNVRLVLLLPLLFLLLSCEKTIEFRGSESEPRLTVAALAVSGEPFTAFVSSSVFFLRSNVGLSAYTDLLDTLRGKVQLYVNESSTPIEMSLMPGTDRMNGTSLRYVCAYLPRPGDRIRLEATFPDFASVTAETQVPQPPRFELLSAQRKEADDAGSDLEMTIRVIDDPSFDKYYFLLPKLVITDASYGEMTIPYRFSSSDIVFRNVAGGIFDVFNFGDDTDQVSYYFSDDLIRGETHTFMIRTRGVPPQEQESRFMLEMRTVTESLYWFDTSVASLRESLGGFLGEGVTIYSNVEGGYGVLCASSSASVEVEW